ncbi:MAG TPA: Mur ligase family protein [Gemmatimonadales bacterium]|nr:Mur ligase family protein [Gemmatimonadales bacterium]
MTLPINVLDSRRLTGPSLLLDGPGAVLDVRLAEEDHERAVTAWHESARQLLREVGWAEERLVSRPFPGGVSLALTAPVDGLYAATELNERAWEAAAAELAGQPAPPSAADGAVLRDAIAAEKNPALLQLWKSARSRGVTFLSGEELVSVGSGSGVLVWPSDHLPDAASIDWSKVTDIPVALITGSNGKTTVVRLLAEMVRQAGLTPGLTSTEGATAGSALIAEGDYSGPSGARLVLRRTEVEVAILETARGGILRRGLPMERARVAVVTNVAEDHLGEFGIETMAQLADTKLVVAKVLDGEGTLVLNADDPMLVERHRRIAAPITWFSLDFSTAIIRQHARRGGTTVAAREGAIVLGSGSRWSTVASMAEVPITFGGTAEHNVANVLAAVAAGTALGLGIDPITAALRRFGRGAGDNPGRANLVELGDVRILIDYAHNPHGMLALVKLAQRLSARRRLVMVGQAGDRSDEAIRQLARAAWSLRPHHVVVKDMGEYLRGRPPGQVPALLHDEFVRLGMEDRAISRAGPDVEGVRLALQWARPGDLLVLAVHQDRPAVMALLDRLHRAGWEAGTPFPTEAA